MKSLSSIGLAVLACLLWATAFLGVKVGLITMPPLLFAGIRFTLAGLLVSAFSIRKGLIRQFQDHGRVIVFVGFLQTFLLYSLFFMSLDRMRASTGAIVNGMGPLIVALSAHIFLPHSRLNMKQFAALILGVCGVVLLVVNGASLQGSDVHNELPGILLMLGGLIAGALASVVVSRSSDGIDPFVLNAGQLLSGGLMLLLAALISGNQPHSPEIGFQFIGALIWLILVTSCGFSIWYYLLKIKKEPLSRMAVWKFLIPLGGAIISWVFLDGDSPDLLSLGGMVLTALSILIFYFQAPSAARKD